jgi:hypothetical protein
MSEAKPPREAPIKAKRSSWLKLLLIALIAISLVVMLVAGMIAWNRSQALVTIQQAGGPVEVARSYADGRTSDRVTLQPGDPLYWELLVFIKDHAGSGSPQIIPVPIFPGRLYLRVGGVSVDVGAMRIASIVNSRTYVQPVDQADLALIMKVERFLSERRRSRGD